MGEGGCGESRGSQHAGGDFLPHLAGGLQGCPSAPPHILTSPALHSRREVPLSSLIHLAHILPTCKSHHKQDAFLSPGPKANPTPETIVGALQGRAQAMPTQPPNADRHKAAIIANRLSQILCVPPAAQHGPLGPQPRLGFWVPQATTHSVPTRGCAWSGPALGAQPRRNLVSAVDSLKPRKE